ncbi:MAG: efflux RND transporter periplasmic adaptor subunit [bacterium]|nr:efflux RND transporter periplasmic adaptor subunit [bacterium]
MTIARREMNQWVAAALGVLVISLVGCSEAGTANTRESVQAPKPVQVEIATPRRFTSLTHVPGVVEARSSMSLSFRVPGTVLRYAVDEGAFVEQGQRIAELDKRDFLRDAALARAALESAEARAADARRELEREEQLRASNSTSAQRLDNARSDYDVVAAEARHARLQLEAAQIAVEDCALVAPVSGYLERKLVEKHEFATPEVPVAILTELDTLKVKASVADQVLSALEVGKLADLQSNAWPGRVFKGRIARVAMAADLTTHTLPVEIEVANPDLALRPAMVVDVAIATGSAEEILTVPMNAVVRDGALRTLCFVVETDEAGKLSAQARRVTLGRLAGDRVSIGSGLRRGDRVIVHGQHFLREGDAVHVTQTLGGSQAGLATP